MAYDEGLAQRIRDVLEDRPELTERKMFGGLAFLLGGNMTVGIVGEQLMARVGPDAWDDALAQPHAREMDFTGKSMRGFVYVDAAGVAEDEDLQAWIDRAAAFTSSLPPKAR